VARPTHLGPGRQRATGILSAAARRVPPGTVTVGITDPAGSAQITLCGADPSAEDADFLVPLTLVPAMAQRLDLELTGIASPLLRSRLPALQQAFIAWYPAMRQARIRAPAYAVRPATPSRSRGTGAFFSGGVDSFYTALGMRERLDALVFVSGFDLAIGRSAEPDTERVVAMTATAARRIGLRLIHVSTNLRAYSDRHVLWGDHYVGSALAAVALLLAGQFRALIVPSTHLGRQNFPYGTHARLDPLWSTENMRIRVHGSAASRPSKVARISASGVAMDTLRVCWENRGGQYNCGACEKCQRTMVELYLAGALRRCRTLPGQIDFGALASLPVTDASRRSFAVSLLNAARRSDRPLAGAITAALRHALRAAGES
jgi:hypothetical protein